MLKRIIRTTVFVLLLSAAAGAQTRFDAIVREGQLALDTGRLDRAIEYLERAAATDPSRLQEIAPDIAWTYVRRANDAVTEKDYDLADDLFTRASNAYAPFTPVFQDAWVYVRLPRLEKTIRDATNDQNNADWDQLGAEVEKVLSVAPANALAHFLMGVVHEYNDKSENAKTEYLSIIGSREGLHNQSVRALREEAQKRTNRVRYPLNLRPVYPPWTESDPGDFQVFRRGPFKIYHHNRALAARLAAVLEYYLDQPLLGGVLGSTDPFPDECLVYLHADEDAFRRSGGSQEWAGGQSRFRLVNGKIKSAAIHVFQNAPSLTETSVPHELAHVRLVASAHFYGGLPLWLQEGVASSAESGYRKLLRARRMVKAKDAGTLIQIEELMELETYPEGEASDLYYAESLATVEALVGVYGKARFWAFIAALEHSHQRDALAEAYGLTPVEVEDMVLKWIDEHL